MAQLRRRSKSGQTSSVEAGVLGIPHGRLVLLATVPQLHHAAADRDGGRDGQGSRFVAHGVHRVRGHTGPADLPAFDGQAPVVAQERVHYGESVRNGRCWM